MGNYRMFLSQCMEEYKETGQVIYKDDVGDANYEEYLHDFGYCYHEGFDEWYIHPKTMDAFMLCEFRDREYMHELLKDDKLIAWYDKVIDEYERNKEKDYEDTYEDR